MQTEDCPTAAMIASALQSGAANRALELTGTLFTCMRRRRVHLDECRAVLQRLQILMVSHLTREQLRSFRPSVCNRLDRNTSGLVAAGKSLAGLQMLSAVFKDRSLHKYYLCAVKGRVEGSRLIKGYLKKDERSNQVTVSETELPDSSPICTEYEPIREKNGFTLLKVMLITGRTHQIRAHLAAIGHPIVGDYKYGDAKTNEEVKRRFQIRSQMLHSYEMVFPELEGEFAYLSGRAFRAPAPQEFSRVFGEEE